MGTMVTLIPGDGIGPEVTEAAVRVLGTVCPDLTWETFPAGQQACTECGEFLPAELLESVRRNKVGLKGPVTTPVGCGFRSVNVELRKRLALYAGVRPARSRPGVETRYSAVDLVVVRENTEGLYAGLEHELLPGIVETIKVTTREASLRIARFAFDYARSMGRRKVTALHKARPDIPIVLVENIAYQAGTFLPKSRKAYQDKNRALRKAYEGLVAKGIKNLHYIPGPPLLGDDGEATVDGTHPNDLGFQRFADALEPVLGRILNSR